jgi:hypothetical protein
VIDEDSPKNGTPLPRRQRQENVAGLLQVGRYRRLHCVVARPIAKADDVQRDGRHRFK